MLFKSSVRRLKNSCASAQPTFKLTRPTMGVEPPLDASSLFLIKGSSAGIKEHRDRQCRPARAGLGNCPGDPAYCWEAAEGFPPEVAEALQRTDEAALADLTPVLAAPEFKVPFCSARSA